MRLLRCVLLASPNFFTSLRSRRLLETEGIKHLVQGHSTLLSIFTETRKQDETPSEDRGFITYNQGRALQDCLASFFEHKAIMIYHSTSALSCLKLTNDHGWMIQCCLQWCSDTPTNDLYRVYAAISLLRSWSRFGVQVEGHVLDLLDSFDHHFAYSSSAIGKLLSELVIYRLFSIGKYCQRLMANGYFGSEEISDQVSQAPNLSIMTKFVSVCRIAHRSASKSAHTWMLRIRPESPPIPITESLQTHARI